MFAEAPRIRVELIAVQSLVTASLSDVTDWLCTSEDAKLLKDAKLVIDKRGNLRAIHAVIHNANNFTENHLEHAL